MKKLVAVRARLHKAGDIAYKAERSAGRTASPRACPTNACALQAQLLPFFGKHSYPTFPLWFILSAPWYLCIGLTAHRQYHDCASFALLLGYVRDKKLHPGFKSFWCLCRKWGEEGGDRRGGGNLQLWDAAYSVRTGWEFPHTRASLLRVHRPPVVRPSRPHFRAYCRRLFAVSLNYDSMG